MSIKQYDIILDENKLPKLTIINEFKSEEAEELLCFSNEEFERMSIMRSFFLADKFESEHFWCMAFGADEYLKGIYLSAIGEPRSVDINKRNMLIFLFLIGAIDCIFIHNHPDNYIKPSDTDMVNHYEMKGLLTSLGFNNINSYIIGKNGYYNFNSDKFTNWED